MKKLFKKKQLIDKLSEIIVDRVWKELATLKGQIDTGDKSSAPYNTATTSIYLTGNQILLGLTKEGLKEMLYSDIYQSIYEGGLESKSIEGEYRKIEKLKSNLEWQLKNNKIKTLKERIEFLENKLRIWEKAAEDNGFC